MPSPEMRGVARIHLRTTGDHDHLEIERTCLTTGEGAIGLVGVGWGCWDDPRTSLSWEEYTEVKIEEDGKVNSAPRGLYNLADGSLIWTRRKDGSFWLGELVGPWHYVGDARAQELDLFSRRACRWWNVGAEDVVPGAIVNAFRRQRTLQRVWDAGAIEYTNRLHANLDGVAGIWPPIEPEVVIASLLGATDLEDLVSVYLQDVHDFIIVARDRSTPGYEYVLKHRSTGQRAVCSVKSGQSAVDPYALPDDPDIELWAFAVSGNYGDPSSRRIRAIETKELVDFMQSRADVLPDRVSGWLSRS